MKIFVLLLFIFSQAYAQVLLSPPLPTEGSEVVGEKANPGKSVVEEVVDEAKILGPDPVIGKTEKVKKEPSSQELREKTSGSVMVGYQYITSWLPSKKTISYTHIFNPKWSLEAEYSWASINFPVVGVDLGEINEQRYSLQARRYVGNSFHFTFGPILNDFKARLGSDFLDGMGNEIRSNFRVQNLGVTSGIGNRWQWKNGVTFGIDWMRINIPIFETAIEDNVLNEVDDSSERDDIKLVIRAFNRLPTFVLLGLNIGYTF